MAKLKPRIPLPKKIEKTFKDKSKFSRASQKRVDLNDRYTKEEEANDFLRMIDEE